MKVSLFALLCTDVTISKSQSNYQCNNKVTTDLRLLQIDKKNIFLPKSYKSIVSTG